MNLTSLHRCLIIISLSFFHLSAPTHSRAQGTKADYERARDLGKLTSGKVFKDKVQPHWFNNNAHFWYRNTLPDNQQEFILVDVNQGRRTPAFDHARLAEELSSATEKDFTAHQLPFNSLTFESPNLIGFHAHGKDWRLTLDPFELTQGKVTPPESKPENNDDRPRNNRRRNNSSREQSPDEKYTAFTRDHNLHLRENGTDHEFQLTDYGTEHHSFSGRVYWSPDSSRLVAMRTRQGADRQVHFIESSPKDQLQPKLSSHHYLKPGDAIELRKPHLFNTTTRQEIQVSDELFPNPWSIRELRWHPDSSRFTFLYNQRGHQVLRIVAVDAQTGAARALVDEQSDTFIDYAHKTFSHYNDQANEIIWMSERDGWNHLYLLNATTGQTKHQITKGNWVVRKVDRIDTDQRQVWFQAGGIHPDQDPYYIHYCRVNFDGTGLVHLTASNGTHSIEYSPDQRHIIDTWSRVDHPPVTELRKVEDGSLVCQLEQADMSALLKTGWTPPIRFTAKGRDDQTDIFGIIHRPTTFDPNREYPILEAIYAGPHGSFVPKRFRSHHSGQSMSELGFIVVQIDGMGTSHRSKAFHNVCWKNLGDSGFPDRIRWIKAAARDRPWMDLSRVGIYGGSAGGQSSTRALLAHGDFYKAAVSDCGCHDNRMDKIWWNELWMGWPVGPHYEEQSNVTQAHNLQGNLFLIVGELDKNVDPASTMQVVNALIKADKDFDLLVIPGGGHGIGGRYGHRRRQDFFVRHLLGIQPRTH